MTAIRKIKWASLSLIAIFFSVFISQNTGVTLVRFMGWEKEVPSMLLFVGVGLTGLVAGVLVVLLLQRHWHQNHPRAGDA